MNPDSPAWLDALRPYILAFIPLFFAIGAIDFVPVVMALTERMEEAERRRTVFEAAVAAALILAGFMLLGKAIFVVMGVSVGDFMVAGGILLLVLSIQSLLSDGEPAAPRTGKHVGIVPIATPLIAGPAALASTLILLDTYGTLVTLVSIALNCAVAWAILASAPTLRRVLGERVIQAIAKVSYIFLASIAVMMIRRGIGALIH
jgi:multiple antibiotic resistance protein